MIFFPTPFFAETLAATKLATHPSYAQVTEGTRSPLNRTNTIYGPTGLITIPTAYTARKNDLRVGASFGKNLRGPSANYGIVDGIEVGGAFIDREGAENKAIGNAKITIIPSNFKYFEVGIGTIDVADAINQTFYFVGSVDLIPPRVENPGDDSMPIGFKLHAGVGTGIFQEKPFAGGELLFGDKFSAVAEWDTHTFNAALRYTPRENLSLQLGFRDNGLFFGMTSAFRM